MSETNIGDVRAAGFGRSPFLFAWRRSFWSAFLAPSFPPFEPTTLRARPGLPGTRPAARAMLARRAVRFTCVLSTFTAGGLAAFLPTAVIARQVNVEARGNAGEAEQRWHGEQ